MEKKNETKDLKEFVLIKGKVFINSYFNDFKQRDVIEAVIEIEHPFDKFEPDVQLTIRDRAKMGRFDYAVRKYLTENNLNSVEVTGKVELKEFQDRKSRKVIEYTAIEINNIFDDSVLYCSIRDKAVRSVFTDLAKEQLKIIK